MIIVGVFYLGENTVLVAKIIILYNGVKKAIQLGFRKLIV